MLTPDFFKSWLQRSNNYDGGTKGLVDGAYNFSATDFVKPPKLMYLSEQHRHELPKRSFNESWKAYLGTILHDSLEAYVGNNLPDVITEIRRTRKLGSMVISGKVDMIYQGQVFDLKTHSVYGYGKDPYDYIVQLSIYKWLFPEITMDTGVIVHMWTDWSDKEGNPESPITLEYIKLWSSEQVEAYLLDWFNKYNQSTLCNDEQRWMKPTTYAVQKKDSKRALKTFNTLNEANTFKATKSSEYIVITRQGQATRCERFCPVAEFCSQYKGIEHEPRKQRVIL